MPTLKNVLKRREGYKLKVYKDTRGKLTVGIGHLVTSEDGLEPGDQVDNKRVDAFFKEDSGRAVAAARPQATKAGIEDSNFVVYLASVNFQPGDQWFGKFRKTWQLILDGKYKEAAEEAEKSTWAKQTPIRVKDFQKALLSLPDKGGGGGRRQAGGDPSS